MAKGFKTCRQGKFVFPAKLAPKGTSAEGETRWYASPQMARGAQKSSWAAFAVRNEKAEAQHATTRPFDQRYNRCNRTEQSFIKWAEKNDLDVHRSGWPDFIVKSPRGNIVAIEVKSPLDALRANQIRCIRLLEEAGIETYVWTRKEGLQPWEEYADRRPAADAGAKEAGQSYTSCDRRPRDPQHENPAPDERIPGVLKPSDVTLQ